MKKLFKYTFILMISIILLLSGTTNVLAAGATLTGPGTVRAGDTITLKFNINDSGKYGVEATLAYDSSIVSLSSSKIALSGWKLESNGNSLIMYDDAMTNPISGNKTVVTLVFKVKSGVAEGTKVNISINNIIATDGSNESNLGSATYSTTIAPPLSGNANLSSLSVNGATLTPAFAAGTISYDIGEVEYAVSKLDIKYTAEDSKSKVTVSGNSLKVGKNTVTVTVKAENGTSKAYKINVTRKQDPNYVASNDASLSSIVVSSGQISPAFTKDIKDYVVYLPNEAMGSTYTVGGTMSDAKAAGVTESSVVLVEGANELKVVGTAEDGTTNEYKVTVVVMPKYTGKVPVIEGATEKETEPPTELETTTEEPATEQETENEAVTEAGADVDESNESTGISVVILVIAIVIALGVGFGGCVLYIKIRHAGILGLKSTTDCKNLP